GRRGAVTADDPGGPEFVRPARPPLTLAPHSSRRPSLGDRLGRAVTEPGMSRPRRTKVRRTLISTACVSALASVRFPAESGVEGGLGRRVGPPTPAAEAAHLVHPP